MQTYMLGRMPPPHNRPPQYSAYLEFLTVHYAAITVRECIYHLAKAAEPRLVVFDRLTIPTGCVIEPQRVTWSFAAGVGDQHATCQVLQTRRPQLATKTPRQPTGHPDVIRMHMSADDALRGPPGHGSREKLVPGG